MVNNARFNELELIDISSEGLAFQVPHTEEENLPKDSSKDLSIRLYFSQDTYLPINVTIQNASPVIVEGSRYTRYGCKIDQSFASYQTYLQFVQFLKSYAEHAHKDMGDVTLFYL